MLDFETLVAMQEEVDHRGVPQGEVLTLEDRKLLRDVEVGVLSVSEGDYVALVGFISSDRDLRCGSAESVNCGFHNSRSRTGPCDKSDIHVPLVEDVDGDDEFDSVVVEPIPQNPLNAIWTPPLFQGIQSEKKRLLVRGGLFYDSQHIVNTGSGPTSQPKRFTLWEIHPVTAIFVCNVPAGDCAVDDLSQWDEVN
jgi:hypothetical protein